MPRYLARHVLFAACFIGFFSANSSAQIESKPLRIIAPFAAGGPTDVATRVIAQKLAEALSRPVIVENHPGGATMIATQLVANAAPDGNTILLTAPDFVINAFIQPKLFYDPLKDFAPVSHVANAPHILIASAALPIKTLAQLKAYIQDNPGKVSYASAGAGSSAHLATEVMNYQYGITMTHVPYKGTAPAYNDLIPGRVAVMIDGAAATLPRIQSGLVVPLGVTSAKRIAILPDVPTLAEAGIKGYEVNPWYGLVAPIGTPADRIVFMNTAIKNALNSSELKKKFSDMGLDAVGDDPQSFGRFMKSEVAKWKQVVQDAHVKAD